LLTDDNGAGLTPSHSRKGDRRYRYYVARILMKGVAGQAGGGWRLPVAELERIIAAATKGILDDKKLIVCAIEEGGVASSHIASILNTAAGWSTRLQSESETGFVLASLVDRVELRPDGIRLSIRLPLSPEGTVTERSTPLSIAREIPMQLRRRGIEKRLVIEADGGVSSKVDQVLLKAVARAHCWFAELVTGRSASMVAIATREGVGKQYVSRLIRLAFLAPELVERIVAGRQPPELTAQSLLTSRVALPLSWAAQKQALGCVQHV